MFIIFILFLTLIHIKFGLFVLISVITWLLVFILSNFLLGLNPNNREMYIIRIISILVIIFILYYNSLQITVLSSFIIPLSITKITFLEELLKEDQNYHFDLIYIRKPNFIWLKFGDFQEIMDFLTLLESDKAYVLTFELIFDQNGFEFGDPTINLGSPLLISRDSNPWLISDYIKSKIIISSNSYDLNDQNEVSILVRYQVINHYFK